MAYKVVCLVLLHVFACRADLGSSCVTPNGEIAKCTSLISCRVIRDALYTRNASAIEFGKQSQCGFQNGPLVCCGSTAYFLPNNVDQNSNVEFSSLLPNRSECGLEIDVNKIHGGTITQLEEFPWMALIQYKYTDPDDTSDAGFKCAGSLINSRYVLTAAHCILISSREYSAASVRLGEWRLSTEEDCKDNNLAIKNCADPVVNVEIERVITHPDYNRRTAKNDIALIRLKRDVAYTKYIRPICMPIPNSETPQPGTLLTVAGWGATENSSESDYKLKVNVPIVNLTSCATRLPQRPITENQLCAGGAKAKDSCQGDSGGPLMGSFEYATKKHWYQEGIVSWGLDCGIETFPGVYTKVSKYIDWITKRNTSCVTPNTENGTCIPVQQCAVIFQQLLTLNAETISFAKLSQCGYDTDPLVCCGTKATLSNEVEPPTSVLLPHKTVCGYHYTHDRLIGGRITQLTEFPWMALLEFKNLDNSSAGFKCGGTLINHRYVLTAAHCVKPSKYNEIVLNSVRLGEWNTSSEIDCSRDDGLEQSCADPPLNLKIEEVVWHSNYTKRKKHDDIALIRLERNVNFSDYIRPICLPPSDIREIPAGYKLTAAGWGATENESMSEVKLKVRLPFVPLEDCKTKFGSIFDIGSGHICAGGEMKKDSCQGDSGGPIMREFFNRSSVPQFFQEGIVSYGIGCGRQFPGVYTKVSNYIDWILSNMYEF